MKIQYETVLAGPGRSFAAYETVGPAVDCEYHVHPELELVYVVSGYGSRSRAEETANGTPDVSAESAILIEAATGTVLY